MPSTSDAVLVVCPPVMPLGERVQPSRLAFSGRLIAASFSATSVIALVFTYVWLKETTFEVSEQISWIIVLIIGVATVAISTFKATRPDEGLLFNITCGLVPAATLTAIISASSTLLAASPFWRVDFALAVEDAFPASVILVLCALVVALGVQHWVSRIGAQAAFRMILICVGVATSITLLTMAQGTGASSGARYALETNDFPEIILFTSQGKANVSVTYGSEPGTQSSWEVDGAGNVLSEPTPSSWLPMAIPDSLAYPDPFVFVHIEGLDPADSYAAVLRNEGIEVVYINPGQERAHIRGSSLPDGAKLSATPWGDREFSCRHFWAADDDEFLAVRGQGEAWIGFKVRGRLWVESGDRSFIRLSSVSVRPVDSDCPLEGRDFMSGQWNGEVRVPQGKLLGAAGIETTILGAAPEGSLENSAWVFTGTPNSVSAQLLVADPSTRSRSTAQLAIGNAVLGATVGLAFALQPRRKRAATVPLRPMNSHAEERRETALPGASASPAPGSGTLRYVLLLVGCAGVFGTLKLTRSVRKRRPRT